jgi:hypothetical protein
MAETVTAEQIRALEVGPELDRLLEERVLSRDWQRGLSTTWDGAGLIMAAMQARGYWCKWHSPFKSPTDLWWCSFDYFGFTDTHPLWAASADTGPLACARSALLAVLTALPEEAAPDA